MLLLLILRGEELLVLGFLDLLDCEQCSSSGFSAVESVVGSSEGGRKPGNFPKSSHCCGAELCGKRREP